MQDENFIAWGFHCPLIAKTIKSIKNIGNLKHCIPLKDCLLEGMTKRFPDFNCTRNVLATMIHPAFKKDYVVKNLEGVDAEHVVNRIVQAMDRVATENPEAVEMESVVAQNRQLRHLSLFYDESEIAVRQVENNSKQILEEYFTETDKSLKVLLQPKYKLIKQLYIEYNTQIAGW